MTNLVFKNKPTSTAAPINHCNNQSLKMRPISCYIIKSCPSVGLLLNFVLELLDLSTPLCVSSASHPSRSSIKLQHPGYINIRTLYSASPRLIIRGQLQPKFGVSTRCMARLSVMLGDHGFLPSIQLTFANPNLSLLLLGDVPTQCYLLPVVLDGD